MTLNDDIWPPLPCLRLRQRRRAYVRHPRGPPSCCDTQNDHRMNPRVRNRDGGDRVSGIEETLRGDTVSESANLKGRIMKETHVPADTHGAELELRMKFRRLLCFRTPATTTTNALLTMPRTPTHKDPARTRKKFPLVGWGYKGRTIDELTRE